MAVETIPKTLFDFNSESSDSLDVKKDIHSVHGRFSLVKPNKIPINESLSMHTEKDKHINDYDIDEIPLWKLIFKEKFPLQRHDPIFERASCKKRLFYRDAWTNHYQFLISSFGYCLFINALWEIPLKQFHHGGIWFILIYLSLLLFVGLPIIALEIGLGQFSGKGSTNIYFMTPLLLGMGYTRFLMYLFMIMENAVIGSWSYFFLFSAILPTLPWTKCDHYFNSLNCSNILERPSNVNSIILSSFEYWENNVIAIKDDYGDYNTINNASLFPTWHLSMGLLFIWFGALNSSLYGVKFTGKVLTFTIIFPIFALILIFIRCIILEGGKSGISLLFNRPFNRNDFIKTFDEAFDLTCTSLGLGYGGFLTLSSLNHFRDNIYYNSIIIVFGVFFYQVLFSLTTAVVLGNLSYMANLDINNLMGYGNDIIYIAFSTVLANIEYANVWIILYTLILLTLVTNYLLVGFEICTTELADLFVSLKDIKQKKPTIMSIFTASLFVISLFLATPIGNVLMIPVRTAFRKLVIPSIISIQLLWVGLTYGFRQLQHDFIIMSIYNIGSFPFFMTCYFIPTISLTVFIYHIYNIEPNKGLDRINDNPQYLDFIGLVLSYGFLIPLLHGIPYQMIKLRLQYYRLSFTEYIQHLLKPLPEWGPRLKLYWAYSNIYRKKLRDNTHVTTTLSATLTSTEKPKTFSDRESLRLIIIGDMMENIRNVGEFKRTLANDLFELRSDQFSKQKSLSILENLELLTLHELDRIDMDKIEENPAKRLLYEEIIENVLSIIVYDLLEDYINKVNDEMKILSVDVTENSEVTQHNV